MPSTGERLTWRGSTDHIWCSSPRSWQQWRSTPSGFRPICLQNCSLKILSKVLTTRLQKEIPSLIDLHQTSFIKGRSIADTFVYALELVQVCHKRKRPAIVLKLDFAKAFDTVNWDGLLRVLHARGFCQRWIQWMHTILSTS